MAKSLSQKIVSDFIGDNVIAFYPSGVDGTPCVEYRAMGIIRSAQVMDLAKTILAHKRFMAKLAKKS